MSTDRERWNVQAGVLLVAFLLLLAVGIGGLVVTADMQPCWPNCNGGAR
jgi:hypothetical protein